MAACRSSIFTDVTVNRLAAARRRRGGGGAKDAFRERD